MSQTFNTTTENNPKIIYEVLFGIEKLADIIKRAHRLCALVSDGAATALHVPGIPLLVVQLGCCLSTLELF